MLAAEGAGALRAYSLVRPQTPGAQSHPLYPAVYLQAHPVNVGEPPGVGGPLGMADVVAKLAALTANPALGHESSSLTA